MPYDKTKPYSCPCCGYWNGDMKYDYYKDKKPLIKDEKIRNAVRAWAEVNSIGNARYTEIPDRILCVLTDTDDNDYDIHFVGHIPTLEDGDDYTIDELCGEEEE